MAISSDFFASGTGQREVTPWELEVISVALCIPVNYISHAYEVGLNKISLIERNGRMRTGTEATYLSTHCVLDSPDTLLFFQIKYSLTNSIDRQSTTQKKLKPFAYDDTANG